MHPLGRAALCPAPSSSMTSSRALRPSMTRARSCGRTCGENTCTTVRFFPRGMAAALQLEAAAATAGETVAMQGPRRPRYPLLAAGYYPKGGPAMTNQEAQELMIEESLMARGSYTRACHTQACHSQRVGCSLRRAAGSAQSPHKRRRRYMSVALDGWDRGAHSWHAVADAAARDRVPFASRAAVVAGRRLVLRWVASAPVAELPALSTPVPFPMCAAGRRRYGRQAGEKRVSPCSARLLGCGALSWQTVSRKAAARAAVRPAAPGLLHPTHPPASSALCPRCPRCPAARRCADGGCGVRHRRQLAPHRAQVRGQR
jgi:hypothetical protein